MAPTARGQERFWVTGKQNSSCWVYGWYFLLLDPPRPLLCRPLASFPSSTPEMGCYHFGRPLFMGVKLVFGFHKEGIISKVRWVLVSCAALLLALLSPRQQQAPSAWDIYFFFGCGVSWESLLLFQIPWVLIWVTWNINTIRVSRIPLTSIFALSLVLQALCFRQQLKWDLNY